MALYKYEKAPIKRRRDPVRKEDKKVEDKLTVAESIDKVVDKLYSNIRKTKLISVILPFVFIISGLGILYSQTKPMVVHFIQAKFSNKLNQEVIPLIPDSYNEIRAAYITDPGGEYFATLISPKKRSPDILKKTGTFHLSIDKIQINAAPVTINVDSFNEDSYTTALGKGLAHFKGTALPDKSSNSGNIFIYGHSAAGDYAQKNPQDVVTSFTRLFQLNLGDKIKINYENEEFEYIVKKIKEVAPEEVSVLEGDGGSDTLTLMTCSPPGLDTGRLVVIATKN